jgi:sensor histidine kinase regulating citrate/malate metabolism
MNNQDFLLGHLSRLRELERKKKLPPETVFQIQVEIIAANYMIEHSNRTGIDNNEPSEHFDEIEGASPALSIAEGVLSLLEKKGVNSCNADAYISERLNELERGAMGT